MGQHVWMIVAIVAIALVLLTGGFLARLRYLAGQVGSFECAMRPAGGQRWLSGVASFRLDSLEWYRLMSLSTRPSRVWRRLDLELSAARRRREQGRVVEVHCVDATAGPRRLRPGHDGGVATSALVAWVESASPEQPSLY